MFDINSFVSNLPIHNKTKKEIKKHKYKSIFFKFQVEKKKHINKYKITKTVLIVSIKTDSGKRSIFSLGQVCCSPSLFLYISLGT